MSRFPYALLFVLTFLLQPVFAIEWRDEIKTSPAFMVLTSTRPETNTPPTGKFKILADDVVSRIKQREPNEYLETFMVTEGKKTGLVIFSYAMPHEVRLDNATCDSCPNSLYQLKGEAPPWLNASLETWMQLDHGWNNNLGKQMLKTCQVIQVRKDTLCVEYPHEEVKRYLEKATTPLSAVNRNRRVQTTSCNRSGTCRRPSPRA